MNEQKLKQISLENAQINEHIKEYLKYNCFSNSFECFESEINAQRMSSKLQNGKVITKDPDQQEDAPKLYSMLKQDNYKSKRERNTEDQLKITNQKYIQLLQVSRSLFKISVQLMQDLQQATEKDEKLQAKAQQYQQSIIQYRKLIFQDAEKDQNYVKPSSADIRNLKNKIVDAINEKNEKSALESLIELRLKALSTKQEDREELCQIFVKEDILELNNINRENQPQNYILQILNSTNFQTKQATLAIISYFLSYNQALKEFCEKDKQLVILQQVLPLIRSIMFDSVSYRFCIAIAQKCSVNQDAVIQLISKDNLHLKLIESLIEQSSNEKKPNPFTIEYITAILCNVLGNKIMIQYYTQNLDLAKNIMSKLLEALNVNYPILVNKNLLYCLSKFKSQQYNKQQLEVQFDDKINKFLDEVSDSKDEFYKQELVTYHSQIFLIEQNQKLLDLEKKEEQRMLEQEKKKVEQQIILFEHFVDEVNSQMLQ